MNTVLPVVVAAAALVHVELPAHALHAPPREVVAQLEPQVARLGANTTLRLFADADHSFHVPKASGTTDADTLDAVLDALAGWIDAVLAGPGGSRPTGGAKRRRSE